MSSEIEDVPSALDHAPLDVPLPLDVPMNMLTSATPRKQVPSRVQNSDITTEYAKLMQACGPVPIRNRGAIENVGKCVDEGAVVFVLCGAPLRSQYQNVFLRHVMAPVARRVQRGAFLNARKRPILFFTVSFPHMSTTDAKAIRETQTSVIDAAWDEIVKNKWAEGNARPEFYADGLLTNVLSSGWQFVDVSGDWQEPHVGQQRILRALLSADLDDPTLSTVTVDKLKEVHQRLWKLDVTMNYEGLASETGYMDACPVKVSFNDLDPCITSRIELLRGENVSDKLRTAHPNLRAVVFVPIEHVPFPRLATPLHGGIWQSVHELADAILGHVMARQELLTRVLILPWDALDLPHVPEVSCVDLHTNTSYAYGEVAEFLLTEFETSKVLKPLASSALTELPKAAAQFIKKSCGGSCPLNRLRELSTALLHQQSLWKAGPVGSRARAAPTDLFKGCLTDDHELLLPYSMEPFVSSAVITNPVQPSTIANLPAHSVAGVRLALFKHFESLWRMKPNALKLVAAFAAARNLINPWRFVFFQHASNVYGCLGTKQLLRAFLEDENSTVVFFLLYRVVSAVKVPMVFEASIANKNVDVLPSVSCASASDAGTLPQPPADDGQPELAQKHQHYAYDTDAWRVSNLVSVPPQGTADVPGELETVLDADGSGKAVTTDRAIRSVAPDEGGALFDLAVLDDVAFQNLPYVRMHSLTIHKSAVPFLLRYARFDDEAVSCFFAGTRYVIKGDSFEYARKTLGHMIALTCGPTATDAYLIVSNFPLYLPTSANTFYTILERNTALDEHIRELFVWLLHLQTAFMDHYTKLAEGKTPAPLPISEEQYSRLQNMTVKDAHAFLSAAFADRNLRGNEPVWEVYGRFDKVDLDELYPGQNLRPCPKTVEAVDILEKQDQDVVVHEVPNALHPSIPLLKPVHHVTVPVVFKHTPGHGLAYVGGCAEVKEMFSKPNKEPA